MKGKPGNKRVRMKLALTSLCFFMLSSVSNNMLADSDLKFNPFHRPDIESEKIAASNKLKLRGTVIDGNDSMVNIGGVFYRLNQEVAGYRIVRIESGQVTLHHGVKETVLTLNDDVKL